MAVTANARFYVEAPGVTDRYGLFKVANGPLPLPRQAIFGGLEFETGRCELPTGLENQCVIDDAETKEFETGLTTVTANGFTVRSSFICGAVGMDDARLRRFTMERLKMGEQAAVERIFSEGGFGNTPTLQDPDATLSVSDCTTDNIVASLAALERDIYAVYGPAATLHVPFVAAPYMSSEHLIYWDASKGMWTTAAGTKVSIGNYANESNNGTPAAAGTAWLYITGQVTLWYTQDADVFIPTMAQALNRTTNQVYAQAEREWLVAYECAKFAINVTLCAAA